MKNVLNFPEEASWGFSDVTYRVSSGSVSSREGEGTVRMWESRRGAIWLLNTWLLCSMDLLLLWSKLSNQRLVSAIKKIFFWGEFGPNNEPRQTQFISHRYWDCETFLLTGSVSSLWHAPLTGSCFLCVCVCWCVCVFVLIADNPHIFFILSCAAILVATFSFIAVIACRPRRHNRSQVTCCNGLQRQEFVFV